MGDAQGAERAFDLEDRVIDFAVRIMKLVEALPRSRVGNHVAGQLLRSGTSPAFNYGEGQSAESRNDFVHKVKVGLKELRETRIGLLMIQRKPILPVRKTADLLGECEELIRIFTASVRTAERNRPRKGAPRRRQHTDG